MVDRSKEVEEKGNEIIQRKRFFFVASNGKSKVKRRKGKKKNVRMCRRI